MVKVALKGIVFIKKGGINKVGKIEEFTIQRRIKESNDRVRMWEDVRVVYTIGLAKAIKGNFEKTQEGEEFRIQKVTLEILEEKEEGNDEEGWELDLFSTPLSRKHSRHRMVGNKRYVKMVKERRG